MSNAWFNLRILVLHIQILKGRLFIPTLSYNPWWLSSQLLIKPVWLHACNFKEGWKERNNWEHWKPWTTGEIIKLYNEGRK